MSSDPLGEAYGELNEANEEICRLMGENERLRKEVERVSSVSLKDDPFNKATDELCRLMNESSSKINRLTDENEKLKKENKELKETLEHTVKMSPRKAIL